MKRICSHDVFIFSLLVAIILPPIHRAQAIEWGAVGDSVGLHGKLEVLVSDGGDEFQHIGITNVQPRGTKASFLRPSDPNLVADAKNGQGVALSTMLFKHP